jgi:hypothetical protein
MLSGEMDLSIMSRIPSFWGDDVLKPKFYSVLSEISQKTMGLGLP